MRDLHSFLYPQGFHIGHLFLIVKNIGDGNFSYPFNPETYYPKAHGETKGSFERQFAYKIWALMEMELLEDHRKTNNHLSYQRLTEKGKGLYDQFDEIDFPQRFFDRRSADSWDMTFGEYKFIQFTRSLENDCARAFEILKDAILGMKASQDLIAYFLRNGIRRIDRHRLYDNYFEENYVRKSFTDRSMTPPSKSVATSRRRLTVVIGLLECIDIIKGWGGIASDPVTLVKVPEDIFRIEEDEIEAEITDKISRMSDEDIEQRLSELEETLPSIEPTYPTEHAVDKTSPSYPRNRELEGILKKLNDYTCQYCSEKGFEKETGGLYIEGHHMIPMSIGERYGSNPDVPSNVLILCSWCHRKLDRGSTELKETMYSKLVANGVITAEKLEELKNFNVI